MGEKIRTAASVSRAFETEAKGEMKIPSSPLPLLPFHFAFCLVLISMAKAV